MDDKGGTSFKFKDFKNVKKTKKHFDRFRLTLANDSKIHVDGFIGLGTLGDRKIVDCMPGSG